MDRRDVLRRLSAGAAWPFIDGLLPVDLFALLTEVHAAAQSADGARFRALDVRAAQTVETACERLIPADGTPGAAGAGVPRFIDHMLADWYEPEERERFLRGLHTLDVRSETVHGRAFVQCTVAQQHELLSAFDDEAQRLPSDRRSAHWFGMLKYLTVWGYCTSEPGMKALLLYPQPMKYDGAAPYERRS